MEAVREGGGGDGESGIPTDAAITTGLLTFHYDRKQKQENHRRKRLTGFRYVS